MNAGLPVRAAHDIAAGGNGLVRDTGEHELALTRNAQDLLDQSERALARIDAGTYGVCESCGQPIGKARLQAFPRATLCVTCKHRQDRR